VNSNNQNVPNREHTRNSDLVPISEILPDVLAEVIDDWPSWTENVGPFSAELEQAIIDSFRTDRTAA
jgi:hypothetical protein